jgi:hypothetical protein
MDQDNGVQETEVKAQVETAFGSNTVEQTKVVEKPAEVKQEEVKRVPLAELQKERQRRRIAEEEVTRFRQELDEVKASQKRYEASKDEDDLIDEAEKSLKIDREQARKLINLQKKAAERVVPKQAQQQMSDPALVAMDRFKQRAAEASRDYEDWDQMIPSMQAIMARELQENGLGAYSKSPEYYYSKALRAQQASEAKVKQEVSVDRDNNANLSSAESGGGSKRAANSKINQAVFNANRSNPKWIRENREEINQLISQGKLT